MACGCVFGTVIYQRYMFILKSNNLYKMSSKLNMNIIIMYQNIITVHFQVYTNNFPFIN